MLFTATYKAVMWLYETVLVLLDWITDEKYDFVLRYVTAKRAAAKADANNGWTPLTASAARAAGLTNLANKQAYSAPDINGVVVDGRLYTEHSELFDLVVPPWLFAAVGNRVVPTAHQQQCIAKYRRAIGEEEHGRRVASRLRAQGTQGGEQGADGGKGGGTGTAGTGGASDWHGDGGAGADDPASPFAACAAKHQWTYKADAGVQAFWLAIDEAERREIRTIREEELLREVEKAGCVLSRANRVELAKLFLLDVHFLQARVSSRI